MNGTLAALALAVWVFAGAWSPARAEFARDGAIIRNSGSTNTTGYTIQLWSDGSARVQEQNRGLKPIGAATGASLPKNITDRFFADVKAARGSRMISRSCVKSVSFGSVTNVQWHGWTSPDLECPNGGYAASLANDVHEIIAALGVQNRAHRIRMLPNEPRRAPVEPAASTKPTGEPAQP